MPTEQIGKYEIDFEASELPESAGWAAYVAVFGQSDNPAHRNDLVPRKRVGLDQKFETEAAALEAAHRIARTMLE